MLQIFVILLGVFVFSSLIEKKVKIPKTISFLTFALVSNYFNHELFHTDGKEFDSILLGLLPLFIAADAFSLKFKELKENALSLIYTAFISILLSICVAIALNRIIFPDYNIPISALVMLFCMVLATDPITVTSVFSNFKLPHKLKIIAEGESLFNDAFALIIFFLSLKVYNGDSLSATNILTYSSYILIASSIIGYTVGILSLYLLQLTKDPIVETAIILGGAYLSFIIAEHFHLAGILAIIVAVITAKTLIDSRISESLNNINQENKNISKKGFIKLKNDLVGLENQVMISKFIMFAASIASIVLFVAMGEIMDISLMLKYWEEILAVFIATTLIRAVMMFKFALISNKTENMKNISLHWWKVLTFAGVKGGLSILMVHFLPSNFEFKDLFEAIVFGNIILSTFIYSGILSFIIWLHKNKFSKEYDEEHNKSSH